jgi:hypothetical protein
MEHPYIFSETGQTQARNNAIAFSNTCKSRFGEAASCLIKGYAKWPFCEKPLMVWKNALSVEALLFPPERRLDPPFIGFLSSDCKPIGSAMPDYDTLLPFPAAAVLFPMASQGAAMPQFGRIWVFGKDAQGKLPREIAFPLEGADSLMELAGRQGMRLYADIGEAQGCDGKSWQLAAVLAMDALREEDLDYRIRLASEWIVTGELSQSARVRAVDIGNKIQLDIDGKRTWMIPENSKKNFDTALKKHCEGEVHYHAVRTLDEAYDILKETRITREPREWWPRSTFDKPLILHTLLTREPFAVNAILGEFKPCELHLWPMKEAKDQAPRWKKDLSEKHPRLLIEIHEELLGDEAEQILKRLRETLESDAPAESLFFDISDGTYLLQSMITALAKSMGFKIICRDTPDHPFIKVWYARHTQHFCELIPRQSISQKRPPIIPPTIPNDEI